MAEGEEGVSCLVPFPFCQNVSPHNPTEFWKKNRLPAVYSLKVWRELKCLTSRQPATNEWEAVGGGGGGFCCYTVLSPKIRKNTVVSQFKINITNWNTGWQIAEYRKR